MVSPPPNDSISIAQLHALMERSNVAVGRFWSSESGRASVELREDEGSVRTVTVMDGPSASSCG